jgi:hypothetical protein
MLFLSINQRELETHPKLYVTGCELPSRRLMAKSKEGHAHMETPGRLLDIYWKGTTSPTQWSKRINEPNITFPNISKPNHESPTGSLSGIKLDQMDEPTQGTHVPQVAAIRHRTRPVKKTRPTGTRMGPQIHHCIMGPFILNIALPQWSLPRRHKHTSQTLQTRRTRKEKHTAPEKIHRTTNNITSLPT